MGSSLSGLKVQLTTTPSRRSGTREQHVRAEALRRHREEQRPREAGQAGELGYLRAQLGVASRLNGRLAAAREAREMSALVVEELHETFSFYLAAIQQLHEDETLRLVAARGRFAAVMESSCSSSSRSHRA